MPPFFFLYFLLFILAYLSVPAQGVYIFYNLCFRFLGETSIPHTFSWKESTCIKKSRFALATKLYPSRLPSDEVFGSRGFLHEDIRLDYRYSS